MNDRTDTKHTPGPWKADFQNIGVVKAENGAEIAKCKKLTSLTELEARARLIAAAPDLLEALKDARYALYGNGAGNPKIDAAIAKAEGRS